MLRQVLILLGAAFAAQFFAELVFGAGPFIYTWIALSSEGLLGRFALWQVATYGLLHGGLMHLLFNMLGLYMFGGDVEGVLGSKGFARYIVICVAGGGVVYALTALLTGSPAPVVGASAGVIGVIVAFAVFFPHRPVFLFPLPFPVKARTLAIVFALFDLYGALQANAGLGGTLHRGGMATAFTAHLGGAAIGFLYLMFIVRPGSLSGLTNRFKRKRDSGFRVIRGDRDRPDRWDVH